MSQNYRLVVAVLEEPQRIASAGLVAELLSGAPDAYRMWDSVPRWVRDGHVYRACKLTLEPSNALGLPVRLGAVCADAARFEGGAAFGADGVMLAGVWLVGGPGVEPRRPLDVLASMGFERQREEGE